MKHPKDTIFLDTKVAYHAKVMAVVGFKPHAILENVWVTFDKSGDEIDCRHEPMPLHVAIREGHNRILNNLEKRRIQATRDLLLPLMGLEIESVNYGSDEKLTVRDISSLEYRNF